jgi:hypothetical protein
MPDFTYVHLSLINKLNVSSHLIQAAKLTLGMFHGDEIVDLERNRGETWLKTTVLGSPGWLGERDSSRDSSRTLRSLPPHVDKYFSIAAMPPLTTNFYPKDSALACYCYELTFPVSDHWLWVPSLGQCLQLLGPEAYGYGLPREVPPNAISHDRTRITWVTVNKLLERAKFISHERAFTSEMLRRACSDTDTDTEQQAVNVIAEELLRITPEED